MKILSKDFSPHFSVKNMLKDLDYAYDLAKDSSKALPVTAEVRELFRSACSKEPEKDFAYILEVLRKL